MEAWGNGSLKDGYESKLELRFAALTTWGMGIGGMDGALRAFFKRLAHEFTRIIRIGFIF